MYDYSQAGYNDNFFINYLSRIHRDEDFDFMLKVPSPIVFYYYLIGNNYLHLYIL